MSSAYLEIKINSANLCSPPCGYIYFGCLSCNIQDRRDETKAAQEVPEFRLHGRVDEYGKRKRALHIRTVASKS